MQVDGGGIGRPNANGIDLNRNFPDQFHDGTDHDSLVRGRQPETLAAMKFIASNPFVLSGELLHLCSCSIVVSLNEVLILGLNCLFRKQLEQDVRRYF